MIYFITASKDATVYLQQSNQNTGLDQILDISKLYSGDTKYVSRAIIQFDINHISQSISNGDIVLDTAVMTLRESESNEIPLDYTLYAYPISGSWNMGIGTFGDGISIEGVTWNYRDGFAESQWLSGSSFAPNTTGSYMGYGGVWYITPYMQQSFNYESSDISMDIKPILQSWLSGSIPNNGLILKHSFDTENDLSEYGSIKFFSKETHTIHQPKLYIGWDDQIYSTGSMQTLSNDEIKIGVSNLKKQYMVGDIPKLNIFARYLYPLKIFSDTFQYDINYSLPAQTYYQIKDNLTDDIIIPFSDYSKISCDGTTNYIKINLCNWVSGRTYKIQFKTTINDNDVYFDDNLTFKIIEN
jgi:hypothetical protein